MCVCSLRLRKLDAHGKKRGSHVHWLEEVLAQQTLTAKADSTWKFELAQRRTADRHERDDANGRRKRRLGDVIGNEFRRGKQLLRRLKQLRQGKKAANGTILRVMLRWSVRFRGRCRFAATMIVRAETAGEYSFWLAGLAPTFAHMHMGNVVQSMLGTRQYRQEGGQSRGDGLSSGKVHGRTNQKQEH